MTFLARNGPFLRWVKASLSWLTFKENSQFLIAVLALFLTVYTAAATRKHNRLSVLPMLSFGFDVDDPVGVYVTNAGVGPAIIKSYNPLLLGNKSIFSPVANPEDVSIRHLGTSHFLKEGTRFTFIAINRSKVKDVAKFQELFTDNVVIAIEYCSIYGECWSVCSKFESSYCGDTKSPADEIVNRGLLSRFFF
jgi:hypothetical protein